MLDYKDGHGLHFSEVISWMPEGIPYLPPSKLTALHKIGDKLMLDVLLDAIGKNNNKISVLCIANYW